ncbi:hypothetical protein [Chryseobacterium echinoideorum]|uniref:hypothetical protein n=1 Tax=Chryseobacterium echinoideorum TaxID=1549648 RepID=UPI001186CE29|nr:hypothetical protein [Chryseobacterium echinoideorum]
MNSRIDFLKSKIESFSPEIIEAFIKIVESMDTVASIDVPEFFQEELRYRIQFHSENPNTKLDFFDNIIELEKNCA